MIWVISAVIILLLLNTKEFDRERKELKRVVVNTFDPIVKLFKYLSSVPEEVYMYVFMAGIVVFIIIAGFYIIFSGGCCGGGDIPC